MKIILASASPRRRELLTQMGLSFEVIPSGKEEVITKTVPSEVVMELAEQKAADVTESAGEDTLVIGADTVVVFRDQILGKPADEEEARDMLRQLSGQTHQVYTGVCLIWRKKGETRTKVFYESTDVTFYEMSPEEIDAYVASKDPMDKAGAYGIQSGCAIYIQGIRGDYNNVVGLPIARLYQEMKLAGILG